MPSAPPALLTFLLWTTDTQALTDYVRRFVAEHSIEKGRLPSVRAASKLFRTLAYENKDRLMAGALRGVGSGEL
jgi:20S proteasome alpha/beta subunit